MPHYYVKPENISDGKFLISGDDTHHLIKVLRVKKGDRINLFDGTGKIYTGKISAISKNRIEGQILSDKKGIESKLNINLYQSMPKGERSGWLVEKLSELGIRKIIPIYTERSVNKDISVSKFERWQRISRSASEQSLRPDFLEIVEPRSFKDSIVSVEKTSVNIIPWESENEQTITESFLKIDGSKEVNIFIGPEGGFTEKEIELAKSNGVFPVSLGGRILRAETAGLLAAILVLNQAGEYGK